MATGAKSSGSAAQLDKVSHNNLGALRREQPGLRRAHAVSTTGDDSNFVFQTHDRPPFVFGKHTHAGSIFAMNDLAA